jgi:hypothetical protein
MEMQYVLAENKQKMNEVLKAIAGAWQNLSSPRLSDHCISLPWALA